MKYDADRISLVRRQEILSAPDAIPVPGARYYVASSGDDRNDGLSPASPWKTTARVSETELNPGDGVLFRRGDIFRGRVLTRPGVSYGAYGDGEKPRLYGWDNDLADPDLWETVGNNIWHLRQKILDPGTLVFDDGTRHSRKLIPSYRNGRFVCRDDESRDFQIEREMTENLDIFWHFDAILTRAPSKGEDFPIPEMGDESFGDLYLRCDEGNPGEVFSSIEALTRRSGFQVGDNANVTIDNICIRYVGLHAIAASGFVKGLTVTNCEIGWIGGTIQHYLGTDPNYPEGGRGTVTRFGNGIEIYGGCEDYTVRNCWIYQVYDAGITHQYTTGGEKTLMRRIRYEGNLVEKCVYGIEYFLDMTGGDKESKMQDVLIRDNILRLSGYGWGQQRHNKDTPALIKGWSFENAAEDFRIEGNVFDRSAFRMLHLVAREEKSLPRMQGNTYIQKEGNPLGQYGANCVSEPPVRPFDGNAETNIKTIFRDVSARVNYSE